MCLAEWASARCHSFSTRRVILTTGDYNADPRHRAISLLGATYLLVRNPSKLKTLQHEIRTTFSTANDITLASVNGLKYQNAVISESLRLWPAAPETFRRVVNTGGKMIAGKYVPVGTHVGVYHWVAGHYSRAWTNVDKFVPERWLVRSTKGTGTGNPNDSGPPPSVYDGAYDVHETDQHSLQQPFNVGPRNCGGQVMANAQIRLILANLVWHFDFVLAEESDNAQWMDVGFFGLVADKQPLFVRLRSIR
jgi:cytochrome P450